MSDDLNSLVKALRSGDLSRLFELADALKAYPPEVVWSALQSQGLQITGDGNIVGSGNVAIVVKGESPELATRLAELAERVRNAEQAGRSAILYGQAAALLERGQVHQALAVLADLGKVDSYYRGASELRERAERLQRQRRFRAGGLAVIGMLVLLAVAYIVWNSVQPRRCPGERAVAVPPDAVLALAFQVKDQEEVMWIGRSGRGLEAQRGAAPVFAGLADNTILSLAVDDRAQRIWAGTSGSGLAILADQNGRNTWLPRLTPADGLPGCQISAILLDNQHSYVGTYDGAGLGISEDNGAHWRTAPPPQDWEPGIIFRITSLARGADGSVWVGSGRGVYRLAHEAWTGPYRPDWRTKTKWLDIHAIGVDQAGIKWVGTWHGDGLILLDDRPGGAGWVGPITAQNGLASDDVNAIAFLPRGSSALIGTTKGLSIWGDNLAVECQVDNYPGITGMEVRSIAVSPNGQEVRVGTDASQPVSLPVARWQGPISLHQ